MADAAKVANEEVALEPIDRLKVDRLRQSYIRTRDAYRMASVFLSNRRADHRLACAALDIAATMAADIEGELGELLGEIPF